MMAGIPAMDLDLLPTFAVFAATTSFTETGRRCGLTQPAVHGQVKRLTEAVGAPLYVREGRGLRLTPRGEELAALARRVMAEREAFLERRPRRHRLAAGRGAWTWWLPGHLGGWIREHAIQPALADGDATLAGLRTGRFDLGVLTSPPQDLASTPLLEVGTRVLLPEGDRLARRRRVRFVDLDDRAWVLPSPGRPHRVVLEARLREAGVAWREGPIADDWQVAGRFVALGCGVAAVNDVVEVDGCVGVALPEGPRVTYHLCWRPDAPPPPLPVRPAAPGTSSRRAASLGRPRGPSIRRR